MPINKRNRSINNIVLEKDTLDGMNKPYTIRHKDKELRYSVKGTKLTKQNTCNEVIGFDCETFNGSCKLLARFSSNMNVDLSENYFNGLKAFKKKFPKTKLVYYIYEPTFDECIRFLQYHSREKGVYRFFWNIDFDVTAILKLYDKEDKDKFVDNLSKGIPMEYIDDKGNKFLFTWIRTKLFSIKNLKAKRNVIFTDLFTFYNTSLNQASKIYAKSAKLDIIDADKLNNNLLYWKLNIIDIINYCIKDCQLTMKLGRDLINSIIKVGLRLPKLLVSPASISKANYRYNNHIPSLKETNIDIVQIAYDCYFGGRFEVIKRGFFEKAWLYDIVSEYPDFIKDLPDIQNGIWYRKKHLTKLPLRKPIFAFYKVKLDIPYDELISTIPVKDKSGVNVFPIGKIENWFTWYDLDLMRDYIVEILDCYEYEGNPRKSFKYPFKKTTLNLFKIKKSIDKEKDRTDYNTVKITMNGIYGCTIERQDRYELDKDGNIQLDDKKKPVTYIKGGILFNPIYASHITAFGRWKLFKSVPKHRWNNILAVHTDSIITNMDMSNYLDIGNNLGQWQLEGKGKAIIINSGVYQVGNIVKTRGIPRKSVKNWFHFCLKNKEVDKKTFITKRMTKVRSAIIQNHNIDKANIMNDVERSVNANSDTKRSWFKEVEKFREFLTSQIDSLPLYLNSQLNPNPIVLGKKLEVSTNLALKIIHNRRE